MHHAPCEWFVVVLRKSCFLLQEENHRLAKFNEELSKKNLALAKRLRDNGLDDSIQISENIHDVATVIKRSQVFQGTKYLTRPNSEIFFEN